MSITICLTARFQAYLKTTDVANFIALEFHETDNYFRIATEFSCTAYRHSYAEVIILS